MPAIQHWRYLVTFTVPADGHQFKHNMVVHHLDDPVDLVRHYTTIVNKDIKILAVKRMTLDEAKDRQIVADADKAVAAEGGAEYRPLAQSEMTLTQAQVDRLVEERNALLGQHGGIEGIPGL